MAKISGSTRALTRSLFVVMKASIAGSHGKGGVGAQRTQMATHRKNGREKQNRVSIIVEAGELLPYPGTPGGLLQLINGLGVCHARWAFRLALRPASPRHRGQKHGQHGRKARNASNINACWRTYLRRYRLTVIGRGLAQQAEQTREFAVSYRKPRALREAGKVITQYMDESSKPATIPAGKAFRFSPRQ
jgi:hypothetical protein